MTAYKDKILTASSLAECTSDSYNKLQQRSLWIPSYPSGGTGIDADPVDTVAADGPEGHRRYVIVTIATNTARIIDDSIDWRDRLFDVRCRVLSSSGKLPGGASENQFASSAVAPNTYTDGLWYSGSGALGAAGVEVATGVPPASGCALNLLDDATYPATNAHLYVEGNAVSATYRLGIYNANGSTLYFALMLTATAKLGKV